MSQKINDRLKRDPAQTQGTHSPTADDFKGRAVTAAVLKETLGHPATIYPWAGSALALAWTIIIAPSAAAVAVSLGLAGLGASAFVYNYVVKGPERAAAYIARLRELRRKQTILDLGHVGAECVTVGFSAGAKEAKELQAAYEQLAGYFKDNHDGVAVDRFSLLAEDSFRQGIHILEQALAIFKAIDSIDVETLDREIQGWKKQLQKTTPQSTAANALNLQIEAHSRRISLFQQRHDKITLLLAESNEIESALQSTYLELVDFGNQDIDGFLSEDGGAANKLKQAVEAARRVEQRLRGDKSEEDQAKLNKYIQMQSTQVEPPAQTTQN